MAQGRLTAAGGCAAILLAGAAAEAAAPGPAVLLTAADYAVGAAFAISGAWLAAFGRGWGCLGLATAAGWFAGTAAAAAPWLPSYPGDIAALGYRAFLLHLLIRALWEQRPAGVRRPLIVAGYPAVLLPVPAGGLVTAALIAGLAALAARAVRRSPAGRRQAIAATAVCAAALAVIWLLAAAGVVGGTAAELANDLALAAMAVLLAAGWARRAWLQGAISALVVELGPSQRPAAPVSAVLAAALADPQLDVRYAIPGLGWFDESGLRVPAPPADRVGGEHVTRVAAPHGGEVALIHGPTAAAAPALSTAAATAAALALDSARLSAEVRQQASAVRQSRQRLLAVADAERQVLETRLRAGLVARLQRVDQALAKLGDRAAQDIRDQLAIALDDLAQLARGLFPGALGTRPLDEVLRELAAGMPIPVRIVTGGPLAELPDAQQALAYFFCSECLANVARHAHATAATAEVRLDDSQLTMSVTDDGKGGATMSAARGLRGLSDRVEVAGGLLTVTSPPGGPTRISAHVPLT
jgi:signal transduction histidine kinase